MKTQRLTGKMLAPKFWTFCGDPEGNELRSQHLEHHVGNLILCNKLAVSSEKEALKCTE